jgi:hypothetical protein
MSASATRQENESARSAFSMAAARQSARESEGERSGAFVPTQGNAFSIFREANACGFSGGRVFRRSDAREVWILDLGGGTASNIL